MANRRLFAPGSWPRRGLRTLLSTTILLPFVTQDQWVVPPGPRYALQPRFERGPAVPTNALASPIYFTNPRAPDRSNNLLTYIDAGKVQFQDLDPTVIFVSGTSWMVDSTWTSSNQIEGLGPGGNGASGSGLAGGSGGAYAIIHNESTLVPGATVTFTISAGGSGNDTTLLNQFTTLILRAKCGNNGVTSSGVAGGAAASCLPVSGAFSGGNSGNGGGQLGGSGSSGGGGAAGRSGAGVASAAAGLSTDSAGGNADANTALGGAGGAAGGGNGGNGKEWDTTHGSGGGGGGNTAGVGGNGGNYGAGGGAGATGGAGSGGILVFTWTSAGVSPTFIQKYFPERLPGPQRSIDLITWIQTTQTSRLIPPFFQTSWPVPPGAQRASDLITWTHNLFVPFLRPTAQYDWPVPTPAPRLRDYTWSQSHFFGIDKFFGVAGNPLEDWPNPRGSQPLNLSWSNPAIIAVVQNPFFQTSWPNPTRAYQGDLTWVSTLTTLVVPPGSTYEWFVPRAPTPFQHPEMYRSYFTPAVAFTNQVGSIVFSNPRGYPPIMQDWFSTLITDILPPQANYDQPNPRIPYRLDYTWTQRGILTFVQAPFHNYDWPNPGLYRSYDLRTFLHPSFFGQDSLTATHTYDYPNPRGAPRANDYTWLNRTYILIIPPPVVVIPSQNFRQPGYGPGQMGMMGGFHN